MESKQANTNTIRAQFHKPSFEIKTEKISTEALVNIESNRSMKLLITQFVSSHQKLNVIDGMKKFRVNRLVWRINGISRSEILEFQQIFCYWFLIRENSVINMMSKQLTISKYLFVSNCLIYYMLELSSKMCTQKFTISLVYFF